MLVFIIFYGLDFGMSGPVVFGWVFASHQLGAAIAASAAGLTPDHLGGYDLAWYVAGALCIGAAVLSASLARSPEDAPRDLARQGAAG